MGFFKGSISGITRLKIDADDLAGTSGWRAFDEQIKARAFSNSFPVNTEKNVGFVSVNDCLDSDLTAEKTLLGTYRVFSMRIDRRTVPASTLKIKLLEETKKRLKESGRKKLSKAEKEAIKEGIRIELLKTAPLVTAVHDIAVDTVTGMVYVPFTNINLIQEFADLFKTTFGISLQLHNTASKEDMERTGGASTFGRDFLTWLWFKSQQAEDRVIDNEHGYTVIFPNRIVLESGEGDNRETVICSGNHSELNEAKEALRQAKKIKEARINIEANEVSWEFNYKADEFQFRSIKLPASGLSGEDETAEGRYLERLYLMSELTSAMDNLMMLYFRLRTSAEWEGEQHAILEWAA